MFPKDRANQLLSETTQIRLNLWVRRAHSELPICCASPLQMSSLLQLPPGEEEKGTTAGGDDRVRIGRDGDYGDRDAGDKVQKRRKKMGKKRGRDHWKKKIGGLIAFLSFNFFYFLFLLYN